MKKREEDTKSFSSPNTVDSALGLQQTSWGHAYHQHYAFLIFYAIPASFSLSPDLKFPNC